MKTVVEGMPGVHKEKKKNKKKSRLNVVVYILFTIFTKNNFHKLMIEIRNITFYFVSIPFSHTYLLHHLIHSLKTLDSDLSISFRYWYVTIVSC